MGLAVDGANRPDMQLVRSTRDSLVIKRPQPTEAQPQGLCRDTGDDDQEVRDLLAALGVTAPMRSRGEEAQAIRDNAGQKARRWVVERTHAWMNRFRRILGRWDKKPEHYLAFLHFACTLIAFRAAGLFG
jgi:putative transposase